MFCIEYVFAIPWVPKNIQLDASILLFYSCRLLQTRPAAIQDTRESVQSILFDFTE